MQAASSPSMWTCGDKIVVFIGVTLLLWTIYIYKGKPKQQKKINKNQLVKCILSGPVHTNRDIFNRIFFNPDSSVLWRAVSKRCSFVEWIHWKVDSCKNIWTPCGRDESQQFQLTDQANNSFQVREDEICSTVVRTGCCKLRPDKREEWSYRML